MRTVIYLLLPILVILSGCVGIHKAKIEDNLNGRTHKTKINGVVEPQEEKFFNGTQPELGIALSGGGLRSASFSYGVLKRLFDEKILQETDILSTVSGGGYIGYNIVQNEIYSNEKTAKFGAATFAPSIFPQRLFDQYLKSNFYTYGEISKSITSKSALIHSYEKNIKYTFGNKWTTGQETITSLESNVSSGKIPYLVINTTLRIPKRDVSPYEFTPIISGNSNWNYSKYAASADTNLLKLVAISGAAFAPMLKQKIMITSSGSTFPATLSDGGHSENLGALALIRRGVKNIIIVDAEHDPEYQFGAYQKLQNRLNCPLFKIPEIESIIDDSPKSLALREKLISNGRVDKSVFTGDIECPTIDGKISKSHIIYVKMMNSRSVDKMIAAQNIEHGKQNDKYIRDKLEENGTRPHWWNWKKQWDPKILHAEDLYLKDLFAYHLNEYPKTLANSFNAKLANILPVSFTKVYFPQYSTGDQSYFNDQFLAFVALGYFSAGDISLNLESSHEKFD